MRAGDLRLEFVHGFLQQGDARIGHLGVDLQGVARALDQGLELHALLVELRLSGEDAGMLRIEAFLEQVLDVAFRGKNVVLKPGQIGRGALHALEGADKFSIGERLGAIVQHAPLVGVLLGLEQVALPRLEFLGDRVNRARHVPVARIEDDVFVEQPLPELLTIGLPVGHQLLLVGNLLLQGFRAVAAFQALLVIADFLVGIDHRIGDGGRFLGIFAAGGDLDQVGPVLEVDGNDSVEERQRVLHRQLVEGRMVVLLGPALIEAQVGDDRLEHRGRMDALVLGLEFVGIDRVISNEGIAAE